MHIKEIKAEETWHLRRDVMWPEKSIAYVQLPEDEAGRHFGLFEAGTLVSVVSLFTKGQQAQFRKLATLPQHQGKGYATALLRHVIQLASAQGVSILWCNARQEKASFYRRFQMAESKHTFSKGGQKYVVMERVLHQPITPQENQQIVPQG